MTKIERLAALYKEAGNFIDDLPEELVTIIEEGDWEQDHKYQYATHIVEFEDEFFAINESRSGSYHTDWFYNDTYILPVNKIEEVKVVVSYKTSGKGVSVPSRF